MQQQTVVQMPSLVCIAAPQDLSLLASWENHLRPLQLAGQIFFWSEQMLLPGEDRLQHLLRHLDQADVIIFLVSADLFASEECFTFINYALQRCQTSSLNIIPLLIRQVAWRESPLGVFTCLPGNGIPVKMWGDEDEGWHTCVRELQRLKGLSLAQVPHSSRRKQEHSDRGKFLRLLRRDYQKDLDESLEHLAWLELGLNEQPDAVRNATHLSQRRPDQSERALPAGTSILEVYDEAAEALLLLGEPGAGKSTLLKALGLHLLARADTDPNHPIPVILPLSSWAEGKPMLTDWLVEQLADRYDVPRHLGKAWVHQQQILPLLDGLDEMEETARVQCIAIINAYRKATFSSLVVCSRTAEYQASSVRHRLALQQAVLIQPLTQEQVLQTVQQAGTALAALGKALMKSEELRELATTPLMLSILMLTYHGTIIPELPQQSKALEQQVWRQYMERMMTEKGAECNSEGETLVKRYDPDRTRYWLGWLAQQMLQHHQTIFFGEYLQESWLPFPLLQRAIWLVKILPAILLGAAVSIFFSFPLTGESDIASLCQIGLMGGFLGWCLRSELQAPGMHGAQWQHAFHIQARRLLSAGCLALLFFACFGLDLGPGYSISDWIHQGISFASLLLVSGWLLQMVFSHCVSFSVVSDSLPTLGSSHLSHWLRTPSVRRMLWTIVILGLSYGLGSRLNFVLRYGLDSGMIVGQHIGLSEGLREGLIFVLSVGLSYGSRFGVAIFLLSTILDGNSSTLRLAERISWRWHALLHIRHLRTSLFVTMLLACFFALSYWLNLKLSLGLIFGQAVALSLGLSTGLSAGLSYGLSYWLLLGLYQGTTQKHLEDRDRRRFNQGLHRSLLNSLLLGILGSGILIGVSVLNDWLSYWLSHWLYEWLNDWLHVGLHLKLSYWLSQPSWPSYGWILFLCSWFALWAAMGGLTILRHYTLRLLLASNHIFPLHARPFLDDAVARILLKRQGGGYAFVHRRLLDYCADISSKRPKAEKKS